MGVVGPATGGPFSVAAMQCAPMKLFLMMRMKVPRYVIVSLLLALLLVACGTTSSAHQSAPPLDYATLVERLRADGATIEPAGDASAYPLVTPSGYLIHLNGERVSVFEYTSALEAQAEATQISPDGTERNWQESDGSGHSVVMDFVYAPRWYQAGRLIVLYVGTVNAVGDLLQRELGAPFAGPYARHD